MDSKEFSWISINWSFVKKNEVFIYSIVSSFANMM